MTVLDIESMLMEIRSKGARQRGTIRSNLHALTPQARLIDNPCVIVTSVKSLEHPRPQSIKVTIDCYAFRLDEGNIGEPVFMRMIDARH